MTEGQTIFALAIVSLIVNVYLFNKMSKRDGYVNPISLLSMFMPLIGTIILVFVELFDYLERHYENKK